MSGELAIALAAVLILAAVAAAVFAVRTRRVVATPTERAVHAALHTASLAARALRQGLDTESAARPPAPFLRGLTGTEGVALFDGDGRLLAARPARRAAVDAGVLDACERAAHESISGRAAGADPARTLGGGRPAAARRRQRRPRRAGGGHDALARPRDARRGRRGGPLRGQPDRTGRARRVPRAARPRRGARAAGPDQPALHLQRAEHDRLVRAHRPGPGPRADPRVRRLHPLLVPRRGRVHHAGRGAAQHRPLPDPRTGPVRRPRCRSGCRSPPRCSTSCVPFLALQPLVENAVRHGLSPGRAAARSRSSPATRAPTA